MNYFVTLQAILIEDKKFVLTDETLSGIIIGVVDALCIVWG